MVRSFVRMVCAVWNARVLRALALGCALTLSALAATARADDPAQNDRAQTFEAVTGPVKEDVPGGPLMVAAYAVIWLCVFGYVFRLVRLQRGADENLARLQQDLEKAAKRAASPK
jgi:CcmD family protein